MSKMEFDINMRVKISIPIIGDESIMLIEPPDNFVFRKVLFDDYAYKDRLVDGTGNIFYDFHFSMHEKNEEKYMVVLECDQLRVIKHDKPANAIGFMTHDFGIVCDALKVEYSKMLFRYFSMIHLFREGEIAIKLSFLHFNAEEKSENLTIKNTATTSTVSADMITVISDPMVIDPNEANEMSLFVSGHDAAYDMLENVVISNLEYTYRILNKSTSYINLISSLEVMFLQKKHGDKKEMLAKRIAVFIGDDDEDVKTIYNNVKTSYSIRGNAVHEGVTDTITKETLDELRVIVRRATKKYIKFIEDSLVDYQSISFDAVKANLIRRLVRRVTAKINSCVLPANNSK